MIQGIISWIKNILPIISHYIIHGISLVKTSNIQLMIFLVNCIHPDENSKYSKELGVVSGTSAFQKGITPLKTHKKWLNNVKQINATLW